MRIVLQLFLIVLLGNYVMSDSHCVQLSNWNLHIPNNDIAVGEGMKEGSWYTYVNWLDTFAGPGTLTYKMEYWFDDHWEFVSEGNSEFISDGGEEWHSLARLGKKALGLTDLPIRIPGKVRVPSTLFTNRKCHTIHFYYKRYKSYEYRIMLDVADSDGNKLLTGTITIPPSY